MSSRIIPGPDVSHVLRLAILLSLAPFQDFGQEKAWRWPYSKAGSAIAQLISAQPENSHLNTSACLNNISENLL